MKHHLFAIAFLLGTSSLALSDTTSDVAFVVDAHLSSNQTEAELYKLAQKAVTTLHPSVQNLGAEIIDPDRFTQEMFGDFHDALMSAMRERAVAA